MVSLKAIAYDLYHFFTHQTMQRPLMPCRPLSSGQKCFIIQKATIISYWFAITLPSKGTSWSKLCEQSLSHSITDPTGFLKFVTRHLYVHLSKLKHLIYTDFERISFYSIPHLAGNMANIHESIAEAEFESISDFKIHYLVNPSLCFDALFTWSDI